MALMRYAIIEPLIGKINVVLFGSEGIEVPMALQQPWYDFMILVIATVFITAGGYVINDYFDIQTDLINRGKVIVDTKISRRKAMMYHNILNIIGVAAGFYVSWKAGYFLLGTIFLIVSGLLYFYSASYKRQFLIGNLLVALLTAMVPLMVVFYEWPALYKFYFANAVQLPKLSLLFYWIGGFALFAFLTTLSREIIKDIEDFQGDIAYGRNTMPVVIGIPASKFIAVGLLVSTLILLFLTWYFFLRDTYTLLYLSLAIAIPLIYVIYRVLAGKSKEHIHAASNAMKIIMLSGILYSFLVKAIITWNLI
jgi:4-hydroxybenzoate polyprenyltransferase